MKIDFVIEISNGIISYKQLKKAVKSCRNNNFPFKKDILIHLSGDEKNGFIITLQTEQEKEFTKTSLDTGFLSYEESREARKEYKAAQRKLRMEKRKNVI